MALSILSIGAEAVLEKVTLGSLVLIRKTRVPKGYRHPDLDARLRGERLGREARLMHAAKTHGVLTPLVYLIDVRKSAIYMTFIPGERLKHFLLKKHPASQKTAYCAQFGRMIATLHTHGMVHGDLTTSNVMVPFPSKTKPGNLVMIDFGLAFHSRKIEDLAVDLVNLKKTFSATHSTFPEGWTAIQQAYVDHGGKKAVLDQMEAVEKRIRYA
ncbi:MAG: KEOPS complex kinase/ATPase Bud32 [Candidatus Diapherotrites archaeon]|nr:KEOPS complex kinase/ATPase Bud32 [Candidatus Diapherotrites archaeon]MDZ4256180.1 KEOPS complex kinase/ATPase Bud32 [archaeon]